MCVDVCFEEQGRFFFIPYHKLVCNVLLNIFQRKDFSR